MNRKIKDILLKYKKILKNENFDTYSLDVEVLLMKSTGFTKTELYLNVDYELTDAEFFEFDNFFNKRLKKEPIAYIIGVCEFMGIDFSLNNHTLIPRPDTEILVEKAIDIINEKNFETVLDIGTGSGAIAISIAKFCPKTKVTALDIAPKALEKAHENALANNLNNICFLESNIFSSISSSKFDIIISNPPYIKTTEIDKLEENVKNYEPHLALDGGEDGLDFYKIILINAKKYLNDNGYILFEIGHEQADDLKNLLIKNGFKDVNLLKDLSGNDRVILASTN